MRLPSAPTSSASIPCWVPRTGAWFSSSLTATSRTSPSWSSSTTCSQAVGVGCWDATRAGGLTKVRYCESGPGEKPMCKCSSGTQTSRPRLQRPHAGMVPALYDDGEKDALASSVHDEVAAAGLDDSREGLWRHFVERCRANLHVVLAMSPVGEALRTRCRWGARQYWPGGGHARQGRVAGCQCSRRRSGPPPLTSLSPCAADLECSFDFHAPRYTRNFPGLVNNTVIDWFEPWPEQVWTFA
jgi:hypothetical protein